MMPSKSCRCKMCCAIQPDCESCYPDCCSYHRKNRFCKLRKQWSPCDENVGRIGVACRSRSPCDENVGRIGVACRSRSPCDENVGRIGVAWVAEMPDFENGEPRGWEVEIQDTRAGILRKCKELIEWLNNPPCHLFDRIKGNENILLPVCNSTIFCDNMQEEIPCNPEEKRCRFGCCDEKVIHSNCEINQKTLRDCQKHKNCCEEHQEYGEFSDPEGPNHFKKFPTRHKRCRNKCYEDRRWCDDCSDREDHQDKHCGKLCNNEIKEPKPCEPCCNEEKSGKRHQKCRWSAAIPNECDVIFRKEDCCCHCRKKFYRNAETNYETDILPQKDNNNYNKNNNTLSPELGTLNPEFGELDSKIVCAGVRTSQICRKLMDDKRKELMHKYKKDHDTVVADKSSDEDLANTIFMSAQQENQSIINSNLISSLNGSQRRSSKFRKKESVSSKI